MKKSFKSTFKRSDSKEKFIHESDIANRNNTGNRDTTNGLFLENLTASWKKHHFNIYSSLFCFFKYSRWSYEASSWWNVSRGSWSVCGPGWGWCLHMVLSTKFYDKTCIFKFTYAKKKSQIYVIEQIYVSFHLNLYKPQRNVAIMCSQSFFQLVSYISPISSDAHTVSLVFIQ